MLYAITVNCWSAARLIFFCYNNNNINVTARQHDMMGNNDRKRVTEAGEAKVGLFVLVQE